MKQHMEFGLLFYEKIGRVVILQILLPIILCVQVNIHVCLMIQIKLIQTQLVVMDM